MTIQSDNGKAFVEDLTKELMRRSHIAHAHSTTHHPKTNGLAEGQNSTSEYAPGVLSAGGGGGVYQHATLNTGNQSFHDIDRQREKERERERERDRERAMPLTFCYPEYEG